MFASAILRLGSQQAMAGKATGSGLLKQKFEKISAHLGGLCVSPRGGESEGVTASTNEKALIWITVSGVEGRNKR